MCASSDRWISRSRSSSPRPRKPKWYGSLSSSRARSDCGVGSVVSKLVRACPCRRYNPLSIWWTSTLRLQPCAIVWRTYHSRSSGLSSLSRSTVLWPHALSNKLLDDLLVRVSLGEGSHVQQIRAGRSPHIGELTAEVLRQLFDHLGAPARPLLPPEDLAADLPVEKHELAVDLNRGADLRQAHPRFHALKALAVAGSLGRTVPVGVAANPCRA